MCSTGYAKLLYIIHTSYQRRYKTLACSLDKYKKLQTRHKGLTVILKYKSALLCCISLRCKYQIPKRFYIFFFKENLTHFQ